MNKKLSIAILVIMVLTLSSFNYYTDEDLIANGHTVEELQELKKDSVIGMTGKVVLPQCHASIIVPKGFVYLDASDTKRLYCDYWNNLESNIEDNLGCLVPSSSMYYYHIPMAYLITYEDCGYVEDDDANSIDYDDLLKEMQESEREENADLPKEYRLVTKGWAAKPKYMKECHVLVWAKTLASEGEEGLWVNYDIRILCKDGLVSIKAVVDPEDCREVIQKEKFIIDCIKFDEGYAYKDFDPTRDKVSDWTIGGLVAGGVLAKTGFFAKLGVILLKCWKIIAIAIAGGGAAVVKWFKKKKDEEE